MLIYNNNLKIYNRELRNNMTDAESRLWSTIRMKQINSCQFYRQRIIGDYIVDFYCPRAKLVIEVDGGQHYSDDMAEVDRKRDDYLKNLGLKVLRFNNTEVLTNIEGVVEIILKNMGIIQENPPTPPFAKGGGPKPLPLIKGD